MGRNRNIQRADGPGDDAADLLLPPGPAEAPVEGDALTTCGVDRNFANVLNTGLAFLLVFTAFQTTQMLAATLIGDLGTISLGLIYVFFAFGGFVAPAIVRRVGPKAGMFAGSLAYVIYVASLIEIVVPVTLICSALIGCGAAILWCAQGVMMTLCTNSSNKTKYNSIFWGIFNLCVIPGNLAGHVILAKQYDNPTTTTAPVTTTAAPKNPFLPLIRESTSTNQALFVVLTICGAVGSCIFLLLRQPDAARGTTPEIESRSVKTQILSTVSIMFDRRMVCLLPIFTFTGVNMTMITSWFTRQMYGPEIGLVMSCFGAAEFVGGFTIGPFAEAYGRSPTLLLGAVFGTVAMILTYIGSQNMADHCSDVNGTPKPCHSFSDYGVFYTASILYGLTDCVFQSVAAAICSNAFNATGHTADAWALFRTFQAAGAAACFFISPTLVAKGETYSTSGMLLTEICINVGFGFAALFGHALFSKYPISTGSVQRKKMSISTNAGVEELPRSEAVVVDRTVYTSAVGDGSDGTSSAEARSAFDNLDELLQRAGSSCDNVVKATLYTTPDADMDAVVSAFNEAFSRDGSPPPALSTATVSQLPNGAKVQIDAIATL